MAKPILTIGFELAGDNTTHEPFRSRASLLDWDIVLFRPSIDEFWDEDDVEYYQGKPSLDDSASFQLKECCEHWRREMKQAVDAGKTVVVYLPTVQDIYIDTGKREYSGTGRNQKTTQVVTAYTNYSTLPISIRPVNATGNAMKLAPLGAEILAPYWAEFSQVSQYKVLLPQYIEGTSITTKNGDKPVAATIRSKSSTGSLVLLPDIDFYADDFLDEDQAWTDSAIRFSIKLISAIVAFDKALRGSADITPEPNWAADPTYFLASEKALRSELLIAERLVEEAQRNKEELQERLAGAGQARALLYEKGQPLERAIVEALQCLGFNAAPYKDSQSEFDVVFECSEGRLLGEAEGKDSKAVNVDKLRQLAMNIHEDLQRDDIDKPAKGVLFGNGYRLSPPAERQVQFTDKCISAAESTSTALISTVELFQAIQYLAKGADGEYSSQCRSALLEGTGIVALPTPPEQVSVKASDN